MADYASAKGGIIAFTATRAELLPLNIQCERGTTRGAKPHAMRCRLPRPLFGRDSPAGSGNLAPPECGAAGISFLASSDSDYVTAGDWERCSLLAEPAIA